MLRDEEPMDVVPLEKQSIENPQYPKSNDQENLDIEDPW